MSASEEENPDDPEEEENPEDDPEDPEFEPSASSPESADEIEVQAPRGKSAPAQKAWLL